MHVGILPSTSTTLYNSGITYGRSGSSGVSIEQGQGGLIGPVADWSRYVGPANVTAVSATRAVTLLPGLAPSPPVTGRVFISWVDDPPFETPLFSTLHSFQRHTVFYPRPLKDRVCRFCGTLRKIGISQELSVHFLNAIHQTEGNHLLYDMKEKNIFSNFEFLKIFCF